MWDGGGGVDGDGGGDDRGGDASNSEGREGDGVNGTPFTAEETEAPKSDADNGPRRHQEFKSPVLAHRLSYAPC